MKPQPIPKPERCPFCGEVPKDPVFTFGGFFVKCRTKTCIVGPRRSNALSAVKAWNKRTVKSTVTPDPGHPHLVNGEFQSDKYPTTPRGKVPLSVKDRAAQDLLWLYAQRHRPVDAQFSADLEIALLAAGYQRVTE